MVQRPTILVVDDEANVLRTLHDLLRLDYHVLGSQRPDEAFALLGQHPVQVVVSDQRMPGMSGIELLRRVRTEYPDVIRLLFTGYADIHTVIDAINQGHVYRYISKPWDADELQTVVREAVRLYELLVDRRRLGAELARKNADLEAANRELVRANELKAAFIQVASHELRTPLTIAYGVAQLVEETPELSPATRRRIERVLRGCERMNRLVDQLVAMLQAGDYDRPLERRAVDLVPLLRDVAEDVRPFVDVRGQTLTLELPPGLTASVDVTKIRDAVSHLLLNAVKFTPDGGHIGLAARRVGDELAIFVQDDGVGIDAELVPRLFQPFVTGENAAHHSSGRAEFGVRGIGLGLAIVKAFVGMHGGRVKLTSAPGRGSTFAITLPVE